MMPIIIVAGGILLLLLLVVVFKLSAFFSLIIKSLVVGVALGMPAADVLVSIEGLLGLLVLDRYS
ncbi:GntT/GntP/DsdX family permease [Parapedobacter sp.]